MEANYLDIKEPLCYRLAAFKLECGMKNSRGRSHAGIVTIYSWVAYKYAYQSNVRKGLNNSDICLRAQYITRSRKFLTSYQMIIVYLMKE